MKKIIVTSLVFIILIAIGGYYKNFYLDKALISDKNIPENIKEKDDLNGPSIEIEPKTFDFETVIYGDVAKHVFQVKNNGNKDLNILRLSTSCGCTEATMKEEDKTIKPGEVVDLLVTFDPAVHKDDTDLGELTRIIYIKSNDPDNPETEAQIFANVIKNDK